MNMVLYYCTSHCLSLPLRQASIRALGCMRAVARLQKTVALQSVTALVLTHLTPKRMPSLKALLQLLAGRGGSAHLDIYLSNPALQLLRSSLGAGPQPCGLEVQFVLLQLSNHLSATSKVAVVVHHCC